MLEAPWPRPQEALWCLVLLSLCLLPSEIFSPTVTHYFSQLHGDPELQWRWGDCVAQLILRWVPSGPLSHTSVDSQIIPRPINFLIYTWSWQQGQKDGSAEVSFPNGQGAELSQPLLPKRPLIFKISPGHHAIQRPQSRWWGTEKGFCFPQKGKLRFLWWKRGM